MNAPLDSHPSCELVIAIQLYFDLMYDCDTTKFDQVLVPTAQLHGFRNGKMTCWNVKLYRETLSDRQSSRSLEALREEHILLIDVASPDQAVVKVRVRINEMVYTDYLTYHKTDGRWIVTSKGYHLKMMALQSDSIGYSK